MSRPARVRLLAATAFAVFLVLVGLLLSIPFLVSDPVVVVRPGSVPTLLSGDGFPVSSAQIQIGARGEFVLHLTFDQGMDHAPRVAVRMPDHGMAAPPLEVREIGGGRFQAVGQLTMPGRWEVVVENGDLAQSFDFILAEF